MLAASGAILGARLGHPGRLGRRLNAFKGNFGTTLGRFGGRGGCFERILWYRMIKTSRGSPAVQNAMCVAYWLSFGSGTSWGSLVPS